MDNYYEKLKAEFVAFRSLNLSPEEQQQLQPLFGFVLNGLQTHKNEIKRTASQLTDLKDSVRKEKQKEIFSQSRDKTMINALAEFENLKRRKLACETGLATKTQKNIFDPIERLMIQLQDQEVRRDLAAMEPPARIKVLFDTAESGSESILRAIKGQPATQKLIDASDTSRAYGSYLAKIAPQEVAEIKLMARVASEAQGALDCLKISLGHIEQGL